MEILRPIPEADGKPQWDIARAGKCGIASVVIFDSLSGRYHLYDRHMHTELVEHINGADVAIGFNNIDFDRPAIEGTTGLKITSPQLDLLKEIKKNCRIIGHGLWGLGPICERTLGLSKSGKGATAPSLAAQGKWAELMDYNLNDVHLTRMLYSHILSEGWIIDPNNSKKMIETRAWPKQIL